MNAAFVIFAHHSNISVEIRLAIDHFSAFGNDPCKVGKEYQPESICKNPDRPFALT
jgi:hypothetical protein